MYEKNANKYPDEIRVNKNGEEYGELVVLTKEDIKNYDIKDKYTFVKGSEGNYPFKGNNLFRVIADAKGYPLIEELQIRGMKRLMKFCIAIAKETGLRVTVYPRQKGFRWFSREIAFEFNYDENMMEKVEVKRYV